MYNLKSYNIYLMRRYFFSLEHSTNYYKIDYKTNLFIYLFFQILLEKKYIQFFYFFNLFFNFLNLSLFDIRLLNFLISKFSTEQELSSLFIQSGTLMNLGMLRRSKKRKRRKKLRGKLYSFNRVFYSSNLYNNNFNMLFHSITNFYNSIFLFNINKYWYTYMVLFFNQPASSIDYNNDYAFYSFKLSSNRFFVLNYYHVKKIFKNFIYLLLNTAILNTVPFFVYPKNMEREVLLFYTYFLYLKTSLIYSIGSIKQLVVLKSLSKFKYQFGIPSFFFILDMMSSLKNAGVVMGFNLPVGGLVTSNMIARDLDYPLFISTWSQEITFAYLLFLIQIFFAGLKKRKQFLWNYFIRMQIIYMLKQKKLIYF